MNQLAKSCLVICLLIPFVGQAQELSSLYSKAQLIHDQGRLQARVRTMLDQAIWPSLASEEQHRLAGLQLKFPLIGESGSPLEHSADPLQRTVTMPILSLKFFEDLATAYAWLWANRYSFEPIDLYVSMLKYKKKQKFENHLYPPPLQALHIPHDALTTRAVDELSLRLRNSGFAFILAHELGHLYHERSASGQDKAQQQAREEAADRFAIDMMKRTYTIPMGMVLWFQATAYFAPNRADYLSDQHWTAALRKATHPLTADRLRHLSRVLETAVNYFAQQDPSSGEAVQFIMPRVASIADILADTELQTCIKVTVQKAELSALHPRPNGSRPFLACP